MPVAFNLNGAGASATVLQYTGNPTAGTSKGPLWAGWINSPVATAVADGSQSSVEVDFWTFVSQPIALLSTSDVLAWNFSGASLPSGLSVLAWVLWAESSKT